jgi:SAM-dependent methyltransferase
MIRQAIARLLKRVPGGEREVAPTIDPPVVGPDGLPLPPAELHFLVSGNPQLDAAAFWQIGHGCIGMVAAFMGKYGKRLDDLGAILDFGCGCGRLIRHLRSLEKAKVYGTDYNPRLVEWCRRNLPFAQFSVNQLAPPLGYADSTFDLIYAFSVFTHLPEPLQRPWIVELTRVLKPGGHLLFTTHGAAVAQAYLPDPDKDAFAAGRLVVLAEELAGKNECVVYHPVPYVTQTLAGGLEVLDVLAGVASDSDRQVIGQDTYLVRKPLETLAR